MNMKNGIRVLAVLLGLMLLTACGSQEETVTMDSVVTCEEHQMDAGSVVSAQSCGDPEITRYTCTVCGATEEVVTAEASGAHSLSERECTVCGYIDMQDLTVEEAMAAYGYYHEDTDGSGTVSTSDRIYLGRYPQSRVTDAGLLEQLNGALSENGWISYGYTIENETSDAFTYQDVEVEGAKYRAVYFTEYRPYFTDLSSSYTFVEQNGYKTGEVYWFAFEPIVWRVLDYINGQAQLLSQLCLDGQSYQDCYVLDGTVCQNPAGTNANDWASSSIRAFLNDSFYNWAFSNQEKQLLVACVLDNASTSYSLNNEYATQQESTTDTVYLLSFKDMLNERYGFPNVDSKTVSGEANGDTAVCKSGTDYALAQGLRLSYTAENADGQPCSYWMLRSAGGRNYAMCGMTKYGTISRSNSVAYSSGTTEETDGVCFYTAEGVAPAITVSLGK